MAKAKEPTDKPEALTRDSAGSWRTKDGRFRIAGEGSGSWYVVDTERRDQLGLELTTGPFSTLNAAKVALGEAREAPAEAEPPPASSIPAPKATDGKASSKGRDARPKPAPETWLDRLEPADRRAVRKTIAGLEALGVEDAEAIVRRDREADVALVAQARILERLAELADGLPSDAVGRLARVADLLSTQPPDTDAGLPGWRLVEVDRSGSSRAIQLDARTVRRRLGG
jgi:hypothetical protein